MHRRIYDEFHRPQSFKILINSMFGAEGQRKNGEHKRHCTTTGFCTERQTDQEFAKCVLSINVNVAKQYTFAPAGWWWRETKTLAPPAQFSVL
jgi:hypothetical protein